MHSHNAGSRGAAGANSIRTSHYEGWVYSPHRSGMGHSRAQAIAATQPGTAGDARQTARS